jgi:hypothetical protein
MENRVRVPELSRIEVIDDATAAMFRAMTPAQRVAQTASAYRAARILAAAGVRHQHPDWSDEQVAREVARRVSGGSS